VMPGLVWLVTAILCSTNLVKSSMQNVS
jgi:hypothetical protein